VKQIRALVVLVAMGIGWFPTHATPPSCVPCQKLPIGIWTHAPWNSPHFPGCQPLFAAGLPLDPEPPLPPTVIRLEPIPTGAPQEPPRSRPITDEPVRPPRPMIDLDRPLIPDAPKTGPKPAMPASTARLHLVLLVDAEAKDAGPAHAAGADLLAQLFKNGIRAERIATNLRLTTGSLTADEIARQINGLPVKADDALVVYYAGAAEFDEAAMKFVLTPGQQRFPRDVVKQVAVERKARLTVVLSDPAVRPAAIEPAARPETPNPGPAGLEKLFFGYKGVIDVHANSVGEFAAARGGQGGCFTLAFVREFGRPAGSWLDLLEAVKFSTNNLYKAYRLEVIKSDAVPAPVKAIFRNQESQVPAPLTPLDNVQPVEPGAAAPPLPESAPKQLTGDRRPARLLVRVPAEAQIWLDGRPTLQSGSDRSYEIGPIPTAFAQTYDVRMEVQGRVGVYRVDVVGGRTTAVELQLPPVIAAAR
jgi:hypothetical protein